MTNEIVIKMSNANQAPKVTLNGKKIKGIVGIRYLYKTSNCNDKGTHIYKIKYLDEETMNIKELTVSRLI